MPDLTVNAIVEAIVSCGAEAVIIIRRDRAAADGAAVDAPPADPDTRIHAVRRFRSADRA